MRVHLSVYLKNKANNLSFHLLSPNCRLFDHPKLLRSFLDDPECRHKSMLSYLRASGLHGTYEALKKETDNGDFEVDDPKARWVGLLEKKWTSVIRLQKKACLSISDW